MKINQLIHKNIFTEFDYIYKLKKNHTKFRPHYVGEKLIRGRSLYSPKKLLWLRENGVNQVIDLRNRSTELSEIIPQYLERFFCKILGINYNNMSYSHKLGNLPDTDFFLKINGLISDNSGKTYIHCRHGKRRTGVCVAIYEKMHTQKSKKEILDELYNYGFRELATNSQETPQRVINRLIRIYNNFIKEFYPEEKLLDFKKPNK